MLPTYGSALVLCALAILAGRGVLTLAGYDRWSWLAPAVGYALIVLACGSVARLPGRTTTASVVLVALAAGGLAGPRLARRRMGRPSAEGLLVAAGVLLATAVPFLANARFGILGVAFNNDPSFHILWAEAFRHPSEEALAPFASGYPLGPHAVVGTLAPLLGTSVDRTFDGLLIATPVLTGLTALEALRGVGADRRWLIAVLTAITYMLAAWYAQAAFKEPMLALFVLGCALVLEDGVRTSFAAPLRLGLPAGVLLLGILYTYGHLGLLWPAATVVAWGALALTVGGGWRRRAAIAEHARPVAAALALTAGLLVLGALPDLHRFEQLANQLQLSPATGPAGISVTDVGNLVGPLRPLEFAGVWLGEDFRLIAPHPHSYPAFAAAVCALGFLWALWRRELVLPAALLTCTAVYFETRHTQSPYVAAKASVVAAPFVPLVAGRALFGALEGANWRRAVTWAVAAVSVLFLFLSFKSSYLVLRGAKVGPRADFHALRAVRPLLGHAQTLDLVFDDYYRWNLLGVSVTDPPQPGPVPVDISPQKPWQYGQLHDFDSFPAATLDRFRYVVATSAAAQSVPPPNFHLVARSGLYAVWRRDGPTPPHETLAESGTFGAVLDCRTAAGRALSRSRGTALVRSAPLAIPMPSSLAAGQTARVPARLPPGTWNLSVSYLSPQAVHLSGPGLRATLPASLDRPGSVWPAGRVRSDGRPFAISVHEDDPAVIHAFSQTAELGALLATPAAPPRRVPLRAACGRFVDWYVRR